MRYHIRSFNQIAANKVPQPNGTTCILFVNVLNGRHIWEIPNQRRVLVARGEGGRRRRVPACHAAAGPGLALPAGAENGGGAEQADAT